MTLLSISNFDDDVREMSTELRPTCLGPIQQSRTARSLWVPESFIDTVDTGGNDGFFQKTRNAEAAVLRGNRPEIELMGDRMIE